MAGPFQDKIAIVTGAASGIGAALCGELLESGAAVLGLDRDEPGLAASAAAHAGRPFETQVVDLADPAAFCAAIEELAKRRGRLDFLFNNAGIVAGGEFADMDDELLERMMRVNTMAVLYGSRTACRIMRRQRDGHVVNTASSAGLMPVPWSTAYTASKHAVVGLSLALRTEARRYGVRVSVVCPGLVETAIFDSAEPIGGYDYRATIDATPIRPIAPAEAASAILRGVRRNQACIVFPRINRLLLGLRRLLPGVIDRFTAFELARSSRPEEARP